MMVEQKAARTKSSGGVRLVESPATARHRLRKLRRARERESKTMGAMICGVACVTTLVGLYVNEHAALSARARGAQRLASQNRELDQQISALDSQVDRLKLTMATPDPDTLRRLGLEAEVAPHYLASVRLESSR